MCSIASADCVMSYYWCVLLQTLTVWCLITDVSYCKRWLCDVLLLMCPIASTDCVVSYYWCVLLKTLTVWCLITDVFYCKRWLCDVLLLMCCKLRGSTIDEEIGQADWFHLITPNMWINLQSDPPWRAMSDQWLPPTPLSHAWVYPIVQPSSPSSDQWTTPPHAQMYLIVHPSSLWSDQWPPMP